jgi:hypothetical protein
MSFRFISLRDSSKNNARSNVSLPNLLLDLGYVATASEAIIKKIFSQLNITTSNANKTLDSSNVANVLMIMTSTAKLSLNPLTKKTNDGLLNSLNIDVSSLHYQPDDWDFALFFKAAQGLVRN